MRIVGVELDLEALQEPVPDRLCIGNYSRYTNACTLRLLAQLDCAFEVDPRRFAINHAIAHHITPDLIDFETIDLRVSGVAMPDVLFYNPLPEVMRRSCINLRCIACFLL